MSDETIDAGLAELTEDVLGPDPSAPATETQSQDAVEAGAEPQAAAEPAQPQPTDASAPVAPTAIVSGPDTFVIDGKTYTKADILALNTTAEQFKHLQKRWTNEAVPALRASQQPQQPAQPAQPTAPQMTAQQLQSEIRRSFDPVVKDAVDKGFVEPDLAELYPDAVAGYMMLRETATYTANRLAQMEAKVSAYEQQIGAEREERYRGEVQAGIVNNMVALSTQGGLFQPLAQPAVQAAFFDYLVRLDPWPAQYNDPEYIADAFAAFKRKDLASGVMPVQPNPAAAAAKANARRQAKGDALPGSRPSAGPTLNPSVLQEMVDDHLMRGQ